MSPASHPPTRRSAQGLLGGVTRLFRASTALRFVIVGGLNTLASYLVYLALLWAGLPFPLANLGSLLFGIGLSFLLSGRIVFGNRGWRRFLPFVAGWGAIYVVQTGLIWLLVRAGIAASIAGLVVLPVIVVASFLVQKFVVFRRAVR